MANVFGVHSVGNSIVTFLRDTYPEQINGQNMPGCTFDLASASDLAVDPEEGNRITLFLYRVTVNEHNRQGTRHADEYAGAGPLGLDLHYLMTSWCATAEDEQVTMTWALRQLHQHSVLDASLLAPDAGWDRDEVIQIVPAELATEDIMRIWDAVTPSYRLSVSYVARLVRIDPDQDDTEYRRVVAGRFQYGEEQR